MWPSRRTCRNELADPKVNDAQQVPKRWCEFLTRLATTRRSIILYTYKMLERMNFRSSAVIEGFYSRPTSYPACLWQSRMSSECVQIYLAAEQSYLHCLKRFICFLKLTASFSTRVLLITRLIVRCIIMKMKGWMLLHTIAPKFLDNMEYCSLYYSKNIATRWILKCPPFISARALFVTSSCWKCGPPEVS